MTIRHWHLLILVLLLGGCATQPSQIPRVADHFKLQPQQVSTPLFDHQVYRNAGPPGPYLHVYIPGDGVPWMYRIFITKDPTPTYSLVVHMLGIDPTAGLFLGRPCYHGLSASRNCHSDLWTFERFSENVVSSMVTALTTLLDQQPETKVILFGVSGGGTLATLMAPRLPQVVAVVTVVGNLNTELWTDEHHFLPLRGSLNPMDLPSFPAHVRQIHIVGGLDKNVTPAVTQSYVSKHGGEVWEYPDYNHNCCWLDSWPEILDRLHRELEPPDKHP